MTAIGFHAVVPAAGRGTRLGATLPKQYLPLAGHTVIELALAPLLEHPGLQRLVVALAPGDAHFRGLPIAGDARVELVEGGATRADSVRAALAALPGSDPAVRVLVHDAARPCLTRADLDRVLAAAADEAGALLAVPIADTLKRADGAGRVDATLDRSGLWQALTPQAFPLGMLRQALEAAAGSEGITDEASAVERAGGHPMLVHGDAGNVKITRPGDLHLAAAILAARGAEAPA